MFGKLSSINFSISSRLLRNWGSKFNRPKLNLHRNLSNNWGVAQRSGFGKIPALISYRKLMEKLYLTLLARSRENGCANFQSGQSPRCRM
jgi:hypothetical protein